MAKSFTCGIIMPISDIDGYPAGHWVEVLKIIKSSAQKVNFEPTLVSDAEDSGIIQKRIVSNIYNCDIVVADVSGKNPNVMFELGMRLAFDKPAIIIKDDATDYSFDTSVIEHLNYPKDLRYFDIISFEEKLSKKIQNTFKSATSDDNYTTFLKHFGEYTVSSLEKTEISGNEYIIKAIDELRHEIVSLKNKKSHTRNGLLSQGSRGFQVSMLTNAALKYIEKNNISINDLSDETVRNEVSQYLADNYRQNGVPITEFIPDLKAALTSLNSEAFN